MFVMERYQLSWEDALHMVQNRRYCISPNGGFLTQIKVGLSKGVLVCCWVTRIQEYEAIYKANRAVASYPTLQPAVPCRKRAKEDEDDDDYRYLFPYSGDHFIISRQSKTSEEERKRVSVAVQAEHRDPNAMET
jgi:serine/threonine/tyrosine-interacting protein